MSTNMNDQARQPPTSSSADEAIERLQGRDTPAKRKPREATCPPRIRRSIGSKEASVPSPWCLLAADSRVIPKPLLGRHRRHRSPSAWRATLWTTHQLKGSVGYAESHLELQAGCCAGACWLRRGRLPRCTTSPMAPSTVHHRRNQRCHRRRGSPERGRVLEDSRAQRRMRIEESHQLHNDEVNNGLRVIGALYRADTGVVEFLELESRRL